MRNTLLVVLAFSFLACSSGEDMALLHREITDVQRQVQQLQTCGQQSLRDRFGGLCHQQVPEFVVFQAEFTQGSRGHGNQRAVFDDHG